MIIAIDFDGTVVSHEYPKVGKDIGAVPVLKKLVDNGHKIILWTMRSGKELDDAVNWYKENNIPLFGINENPTQKSWTASPKAHAHLYIDDCGIGIPLTVDYNISFNPFVNWEKIESILTIENLI